MISNIKFIDNYKDDKFYEEVHKHGENYNLTILTKQYVEVLYYAKYLIEKNNLDYGKIINGEIDELIDLLKDKLKEIINGDRVIKDLESKKYYELLKHIAYQDYEIPSLNDRILDKFIDKNKKYLFISTGYIPYLKYENVDIYIDHRISKVMGKYSSSLNNYLLFDDILGIDRKLYNSFADINPSDYDYVIYYNYGTYLEYNDYIKPSHIRFKNIFAIYDYNKISNYKNNKKYRLLHNTKSIFIDNSKAYIIQEASYNIRLDKTINIKELTNVDDNDLSNILLIDKEIEGISINVLPDDIINNNFRIGLSAYINKKGNNEIIKLIDKNLVITERINRLNEMISNKIDEMIVR